MDGLEAADIVLARQDLNHPPLELSIIIVSFDVKPELRKCLSGLVVKSATLDIIVVDNRSKDGTPAMLESEFPRVKCVKNLHNVGFARAVNQGIAKSAGQFVLLLNPDTQVSPTGLERMINFMKSDSQVGVLGCQIRNSAGLRQYSSRSFPNLATAFSNSQSLLNRLLPHNPWSRKYLCKDIDLEEPTEVDWVSGSCMLVRREVFGKVGYFDPRFFMFVEDVDFCRRSKASGWKVVYFPEVTILHHQGQSVRQRKIKMLAEHHRSMYNYFIKHYENKRITRLLVFLGIWLRLGMMSLGYWLEN